MNRDDVIKGLEYCSLMNKINCDKCPYDYNGRGNGKSECTAELAADVLAMLKEQEAVEPTLICEGRNKYYNDYVCPRCDDVVFYEQNYCSECGAQFRWEGR